MTPPRFLRHLISWRLLAFIDRHSSTCWAEMVQWKLGYDISSWWGLASCWGGSSGGWDYCGKYKDHAAYVAALEKVRHP